MLRAPVLPAALALSGCAAAPYTHRSQLILISPGEEDLHDALAFWQRMERVGGANPPEFLSTHPSHGAREQQIAAWLPEALSYYASSAHATDEPLPTIGGATAVH